MHIAQLLAPLTRLRRLKIFLDWNQSSGTASDHVREAGEVFAQVLRNSLHIVVVHSEDATWREFEVVAGHALERRDL